MGSTTLDGPVTLEQLQEQLREAEAAGDAAAAAGLQEQIAALQPDDAPEPEPTREEVDKARAALEAEQAALDAADGKALEVSAEALEQLLLDNSEAAFEAVIGGKAPSAVKVSLVGGAVHVPPPDGGWKKGMVVQLVVTGRVSGETSNDVIDGKTDQVVDCNQTWKVKVQGVSLKKVVSRAGDDEE